jgi:DNA-binding Lrp family transcriptional regulator
VDDLDRRIITGLQGGFPLRGRPYREAAVELGAAERVLLGRLEAMLNSGLLSRFGPLFNVERMGGSFLLCALAVPPARFDEIAERINAMPQVAHNYARDHRFNMWFVLATETEEGIAAAVEEAENASGLEVYQFPKREEFYVGLRFNVKTGLEAGSWTPGAGEIDNLRRAESPLCDIDRRIVLATQHGLPLTPRPYDGIADRLGTDSELVLRRLQSMLENGVIRRIGAVPNHYALGIRANGMSVWDVEDDEISACGRKVGRLEFVSHAYHRPRRPPEWPFNLFAMVHGTTRDEVMGKVAAIARTLGDARRGHEVLFSTRVLKKSGLRLLDTEMGNAKGREVA